MTAAMASPMPGISFSRSLFYQPVERFGAQGEVFGGAGVGARTVRVAAFQLHALAKLPQHLRNCRGIRFCHVLATVFCGLEPNDPALLGVPGKGRIPPAAVGPGSALRRCPEPRGGFGQPVSIRCARARGRRPPRAQGIPCILKGPSFGASLQLLPALGEGQPGACAPVFPRKREGRKGRGVTVRASSKKESDHVAIRITVSVTASRREPAPEDRPQGHRGPCRQHQDRWRPA